MKPKIVTTRIQFVNPIDLALFFNNGNIKKQYLMFMTDYKYFVISDMFKRLRRKKFLFHNNKCYAEFTNKGEEIKFRLMFNNFIEFVVTDL